YKFPSSNNLIEVPPVHSLLNPELYPKDLYVQEILQFNPRYYYQYLMYLTAKLGVGLPLTYLIYYVAAFSSFILGLYALGKKFGRSTLSSVALVFLGLATTDGTIGNVSLFRTEPIPAIFAMGLAIWGIYFCFSKKWFIGYLLFGLACLLQFLVGVLPGGLLASLVILDAKKNHNLRTAIVPFLTLGALASLVYLPMMMAGNTDSGTLSHKGFVYLYGYIRHPHHIIPSAWPIQTWRNFILFMLGGLLCIKSSSSLDSEEKLNLFTVIAGSLVALLIGYVFVELYPLSLVAKLQLARTTPFAKLMVLIAISALVNEHYRRKNIAIMSLLLVAPILHNGAILLFLVAVGLVTLKETNLFQVMRSKLATGIVLVGSLLVIGLYPLPSSISDLFNQVVWKLALFLILAFPFLLEEFGNSARMIKPVTYSLAFTSCLFFMLGVMGTLPKNLLDFFQNRVTIYHVPNDDVTKLALRFRDSSSKDVLVLSPPSATKFRFYSQRSVVFNFYNVPFTDRGLQEWAKRMQSILGSVKPPLSWSNVDLLFRKRSGSELVTVAKQFDANYILTRSDWHSGIKGRVVDREGKWIIYKID
ncbi:MAG TPA: DUF6798 domain-containing protein, partial [Coleofasciculaceae cyanobacterium]